MGQLSDLPPKGRDEPAQIKKKTPPRYPQEAKSQLIQGTVRFSAFIGKDGKINGLEYCKPAGFLRVCPCSRPAMGNTNLPGSTVSRLK